MFFHEKSHFSAVFRRRWAATLNYPSLQEKCKTDNFQKSEVRSQKSDYLSSVFCPLSSVLCP